MKDLYFTGKNKKGLQGRKLSRQASIFAIKIKAQALYIINFVEIAYHPSENEYISLSGEYIIKPQERKMHGSAVMISSSYGADEMHAKA